MQVKVMTTKNKELKMIHALVHGDSGVGKTTSLGTLPEDITLIIALERSLLPLRNRDYRVIQVECWNDLRDLVRAMMAGDYTDNGLSFEIDGDKVDGIKIVAFDSLSEINELAKKHIVEVDRKAIISERSKGKKDTPDGIYDDQMTQEDWGALSRRMRGFMSAVNHLPAHTMFTCLSAWKEDKQTGIVHRTTNLNGALSNEVSALFDLVFHMENATNTDGENVRVWRTANDGVHLAKDSTGVLPEFIEPDWRKVFALILNQTEEKKK
jgi:DNA polymerase III delta prime subunit